MGLSLVCFFITGIRAETWFGIVQTSIKYEECRNTICVTQYE
jgi:hypothetical protein